ncbi:MAG: class I SAM-dependent methyltransferase [Cyclobacteriaceae bacterium]
MYEKLEECPSCKHTKFNNFLICKDHTVSNESFALVKCCKCQLVFTNPRPTPAEIGKYYKSQDYISHSNSSTNLINLVYKGVRNITLRHKKKIISKHIKTGDILDFGCGTGHFLNYMKKRGWAVKGVEPDENARAVAENYLQSQLSSNIDEIKKKEKFDIITAWHVLEHVHNLRDTLKSLRNRLKEEGYMFIALPNHNSFDAKYYKENWAAYDVPRHLYHFSQDSFLRLAKSVKLQLVDTIPMKFDSYYVSMLSEKYQTGSNDYITAISRGNKSNSSAKTKNNEYSSLIYVLSK